MFKPCFIIVIFFYFKISQANLDEDIDPKNFIISGFGLEENFNLPARYFFIQAVDVFLQK